MLLFTKLAVPKAPKRRSRAGCTSCKERKKKCNEERPQCARCAERGSTCIYEPVRPRQRRKRDPLATNAPSTAVTTTKPCENDIIKQEAISRYEKYDACNDHARLSQGWPDQPWTVNSVDAFDQDLIFSPLDDSFDHGLLLAPHLTNNSTFLGSDDDEFEEHNAGTVPAGVFDYDDDDNDNDDYDDDKDQTAEGETEMAGVKYNRRGSFMSTTTTTTAATTVFSNTDLTVCSPATVRSPLLEFTCPVWSEFAETPSRRLLVDHFCNVLSHLIVFREETGNPFQQLVLPLMRGGGQSSPVADAVYALAGAHLEYRGFEVDGGEHSLYFHQRAIQGLAGLIQRNPGGVNRNEVLSAIILLIYYEVLVQKNRSNIVEGHLKGALTVMCSNPEPLDPTGIFLERAFRFYDVIAALSFGTAPLSTAPAAGCLLPFPLSTPTASSSLRNVDTLLGMATTLWPIIHRLSGLLPLKKDLVKAREAGQSGKAAVLRTEFETTVKAVEAALLGWTPNLPAGWVLHESDPTKLVEDHTVAALAPAVENKAEMAGGDEQDEEAKDAFPAGDSARLHSILNNALGYRHSALVYLYRTVHSHPRTHSLVQRHAHLSLQHCAATVQHQGPMGALLWPLFVAACEAVTEDDRLTAKTVFSAIDKRQGMTNIERAWKIVEEVWRRAGEDEAATSGHETDQGRLTQAAQTFRIPLRTGDIWRKVSEEMGVNIVFG